MSYENNDTGYSTLRRINGKLYEVRGSVAGDQSFTEVDEGALRSKERRAAEERKIEETTTEEGLSFLKNTKRTGDIQDMGERITEKQKEVDLAHELLLKCCKNQEKEQKSIEDMEREKKEIDARIGGNSRSFFVGTFHSLIGTAHRDADRSIFLTQEIRKASSRLEEAYSYEETHTLALGRCAAELKYLKRKLSDLK